MPPFATWYRGRPAAKGWLANHALAGGRRFRLLPTRANGRPAFAFFKAGGACLPGEPPHEGFVPHCIQLVWWEGDRISRIASFLGAELVRAFGFGEPPPG